MKRLIWLVIILVITLTPVSAFARQQDKVVDVEMSIIPDEIELGESIEFTAFTDKHGSSFQDEWVNAEKVGTVFDTETSRYISIAEFKPTEPGIYEISYIISMRSGKNGTTFRGTNYKTVIVTSFKTITGAEVRDILQTPVIRSGKIIGYSLIGNLYALWSDGSATPLDQVINTVLTVSDYEKEVPVFFEVNNESYEFMVKFSR